MKNNFIKGMVLFFVFFALLFLGRWAVLVHESKTSKIDVPVPVYLPLVVANPETQAQNKDGDDESDKEAEPAPSIAFHNYAVEVLPKEAAPPGATSAAVGQTYERVATLAARTREFDSDEKKVRDCIQANQVLVQQETNTGLKGSRLLNLTLGVSPDRFDAVVEALKSQGELVYFQVTKTDKTQDHLALTAKRADLQKNIAELVTLKGTGGKMADLLDLQGKIFSLEQEIGNLGIEIGQFEGATGFCTALLTLKEIGPGPSPWVLASEAFDWAANTCFYLLGWPFGLSLAWLALLWLAHKVKSLVGKKTIGVFKSLAKRRMKK